MRPVIFLDIDGVVVTPASLEAGGPRNADARCVANLNALVETADAEVVISSSWRLRHSLDMIRQTLCAAGFRWPERVIDTTVHLHYRVERGVTVGRAERADEIRTWLAHNHRDRFVVLDDEWDAEIEGHFVRTSYDDGVGERDVELALSILQKTVPQADGDRPQ